MEFEVESGCSEGCERLHQYLSFLTELEGESIALDDQARLLHHNILRGTVRWSRYLRMIG